MSINYTDIRNSEFFHRVIFRFLSTYEKKENGCWEWSKTQTNGGGYGHMGITLYSGGKRYKVLAHRLSWMLHNEMDIPEGLCVTHTCNNPLCVNPSHLQLGSHLANVAYAQMLQRYNVKKPRIKPLGLFIILHTNYSSDIKSKLTGVSKRHIRRLRERYGQATN